jgi:hypothetical protein
MAVEVQMYMLRWHFRGGPGRESLVHSTPKSRYTPADEVASMRRGLNHSLI